MIKKQIFHHIFGLGDSFVQLEGRSQWWPINDHHWQTHSIESIDFYVEGFQPDNTTPNQSTEHNTVIPIETALQKLHQKKLDSSILDSIIRDLKAEYETLHLEKLIASIDKHLKQDQLYK